MIFLSLTSHHFLGFLGVGSRLLAIKGLSSLHIFRGGCRMNMKTMDYIKGKKYKQPTWYDHGHPIIVRCCPRLCEVVFSLRWFECLKTIMNKPINVCLYTYMILKHLYKRKHCSDLFKIGHHKMEWFDMNMAKRCDSVLKVDRYPFTLGYWNNKLHHVQSSEYLLCNIHIYIYNFIYVYIYNL